MAIHGINHKSRDKNVQIESQSVNSVLLDTDPSDYHERQEDLRPLFSNINYLYFNLHFITRLFVAGRVCMNEIDRLTMWDSTMMPNIPGIPAIICLMFSPCVEIRYIPFKLGLCFGMNAQTRNLNPPCLPDNIILPKHVNNFQILILNIINIIINYYLYCFCSQV